MDDDEAATRQTTYPVPEATVATDPVVLTGLAAAILGVLIFWRRRKPTAPPSR